MGLNKIAVLADVHSNFCALETVLAHAEQERAEEIWFLGDAVGYGPEPNRCLRLLMDEVNPAAWVRGNHDEAMRYPPADEPLWLEKKNTQGNLENLLTPIVDQIGTSPDTHTAFRINYHILEAFPERLNFLLSRNTEAVIESTCFMVHGGLRNETPTITYTKYLWDARDEFAILENRFKAQCPNLFFVGHSHLPTCFKGKGAEFEAVNLQPGQAVQLDDQRWLLNPGSIGQPRDGDWRASYMILDKADWTVVLHRLEYDLAATQKRMAEHGMPVNLINRLAVGR